MALLKMTLQSPKDRMDTVYDHLAGNGASGLQGIKVNGIPVPSEVRECPLIVNAEASRTHQGTPRPVHGQSL